MVLMCEPIIECLKTLTTDDSIVILMSPLLYQIDMIVINQVFLNRFFLMIDISAIYEYFREMKELEIMLIWSCQ